MKSWLVGMGTAMALTVAAEDARACGGFFCSRAPVDQAAERLIFAIGPDSTTMIVQIGYSGGDDNFSWVLPLGSVPDPDSLEVFPQLALSSLDGNTGPMFTVPDDCWQWFPAADASSGGGDSRNDDDGVNVHIRKEVGPYDVAVVESPDPNALVNWLRSNGYRITEPMVPYVSEYSNEGMKFLALKLLPGADTSQIEPLKLTLPGQTPSIPIRLSAVASEPEMGILTIILGSQRYEPANWPHLTINDDEIVFNLWSAWSSEFTNWTALVARKVDDAGGQGFITEFAGATAPLVERVSASPVNTDEQRAAQTALLQLLEGRSYMTRLYTRLSPEEMSSDPVFRRSLLGDVAREHALSRYVNGVDMCMENQQVSPSPCEFTACGAGGTCREDAAGNPGCACLAQATARSTTSPNGSSTVTCQDARMSFVNPGDRDEATGELLADPCLATTCGEHGSCVSVNMTPTCSCDRGFIAVNDGTSLRCASPTAPIPESFYERTMPEPRHPGRQEEPPPARRFGGCVCAEPTSNGIIGPVFALALLALASRGRRRRVSSALLVIPFVALFNGCGVLPATLEIGTGESEFETLREGQEVSLVRGVQGGHHMWLSLRVKGLDPEKVWLDVATHINGEEHKSRAVTRLNEDGDTQLLIGWPLIVAEPQTVAGQRMNVGVTLTDEQGDAVDGTVSVIPRMPASG